MSFFSFLQPDKSFRLFKKLKQFKRPIKNRKAEGYISVCIITVAVYMLLSLALSFISAVTAVNASKRQVRAALDGFVTGQSIEIYNGVKSYSELVSGLDSEGFTQALCDYAGLQNNGDTLTGAGYEIKNMTFEFREPDRLNYIVKYTLKTPVSLGNINITYAEVPIKVTGVFYYKF